MRLLVNSIGVLAVAAIAGAEISQVAAHHSASMFDVMRTEVLKGKALELRWVNPHVMLTVKGTLKSGGRLDDRNDEPRKPDAAR